MKLRNLVVLAAAAALASFAASPANAIGSTDSKCIPHFVPPDCED